MSREFEVLQDMLSDELEVVRDMGFGLPSGAVEITDGEPAPRPLPPLARPLAKSDVVTVGVFRVRATKPGENPHGYTYVIEHAHGGLVPYPHGGYTKSLGFFRRQDAIEEAHLVWAITSEPRPATLRFRKGFYPLMKA